MTSYIIYGFGAVGFVAIVTNNMDVVTNLLDTL